MTILRERIETTLPVADAFAFVADFAERRALGPGRRQLRADEPGPVAVGARYRLGVRMGGRVAPMDYEVDELEPTAGGRPAGEAAASSRSTRSNSRRSTTGTRIDYTADIRLVGLLRLAAPFAGGAFAGVGSRAREGMRLALDRRATGA